MRKLSRKETAKINGGIAPGQCFYIDSDGVRRIGCRRIPFQDGNGNWVYPIISCAPCNIVEEI